MALLSNKSVEKTIRWLIRRDLDKVLDIEKNSFDSPWVEKDFLVYLRKRNCIGLVYEIDFTIVGFMIYELHKNYLEIKNLAIDPDQRHKNYGSDMIKRMQDKLNQQKRQFILLNVKESNLGAHLFFQKNEFKAVKVIRKFYEDTSEDAYEMKFSIKPEVVLTSDHPWFPKNRITNQ